MYNHHIPVIILLVCKYEKVPDLSCRLKCLLIYSVPQAVHQAALFQSS